MADSLDQVSAAFAGSYVIDRQLGRGGMATVYLAHDPRLQRRVALKVLHGELAATIAADRFLREVRTTAQLAHPHIVPLLDSGKAEGLLYYTMPYVDGGTLRDQLKQQKQLAIDDAITIATQLAAALAYAHGLGIVHRDIKPENVLFSAGHAVLADFGIARALSEAASEPLTATGIAIGTPQYMSPEQAAGEQDLDARSDIYSLGCVLYELLVGEPPFAATSPLAVFARKATETVGDMTILRKGVPRHIQAAVSRALARVPADRYATARSFAAALTSPTTALPETSDGTIAVLPFSNLSAEPENEYFSDGITEEVINAVAHIPGMRVTARTSVFQFKSHARDVREIGQTLSVQSVLEGSVRRLGKRVRVTAQLIDVASGFHLWSERFDREIEDIFVIQDQIADAIARRLETQFASTPGLSTASAGPGARGARVNPAAYDAYLRGRYAQRQMFTSSDAVASAVRAYDEAVALDPSFAMAYSAMAQLYVLLSLGFTPRPSRELLPKALAAAERALALDETLAEAHLARALVAMYHEWNFPAAKAGIDRALAINASSVDAHFWAEFYHTYVERDFGQAIAANRRAAELDPLDLNISARLAQVLLMADRVDEAIERLTEILRTDPRHLISHVELADAYLRKGQREQSLAAMDRALELSGGGLVAVLGPAIAMFAIVGRTDRARDMLRQLTERAAHDYVYPFWLAVCHAALGDMDRAFEYLAQAQCDHDPNLLYLSAVPPAVNWRSDDRYRAAVQAMGLPHLAGDTVSAIPSTISSASRALTT